MTRVSVFFFIIIFQTFSLFAQKNLNRLEGEQLYKTGLELIEKEKYAAAREAFERYTASSNDDLNQADARYYIAYSALRLYNKDGERLLNGFIEDYPGHPKARVAYYELGNFYFREKNFRKAIKYLEAADPAYLKADQKNDAQFKIGYSYFGFKEFDKALPYFNKVKGGSNRFSHAASYYAGYIEYMQMHYEQALNDLQKASENESYRNVAPYLIVSVYNKQGRYDDLIKYSAQSMNDPGVKNREEIMALTGDAYFNKGDYAMAIESLAPYVEKNKTKTPADIHYKLGYARYQTGKYKDAIENFKQVALTPDTLGQFASYYLGILYIKDDNKLFAATAFERAKAASFDEQIRRESTFNLGKVNYDLGKYAEAIAAFREYISINPGGERVSEANDLIGEAYMKTTNYDLAIEHIESQRNPSEKMRQVYQTATYHKGVELFNARRYYNAVQMFEKSLRHPFDKSVAAQAYFWMGEAYSIGEKYDEAIAAYSGVFRNASEQDLIFQRARYGSGYAYYNNRQYDKALPYFRDFVPAMERMRQRNNYYHDALLRLGDSYYAVKDYSRAIAAYDKAIDMKVPETDYAYYQKGVVHGILGNLTEAKAGLNTVIDRFQTSKYLDDAMFEFARLDFENGNYESAVSGFSRLISRQRQSPYTPYAYVRRALSYYNLKDYDRTIADYKTVIDQYASHETANSALLGLQEALSIQGAGGQFEPYLAKYKQANPDNKDVRGIELESAKTLYYNQNYDRAIAALQDFIHSYPDSEMLSEAKYFLGESYYRNNQVEPALKNFYETAADPVSKDRNRAINRIAELEYVSGNYSVAIEHFRKLVASAANKKEEYYGWSGLMESYYQVGKYDSVNHYAKIILDRGAVSVNAQNKARVFQGKAAYARNDNDEAVDHFMAALNSAKDESGAEAQYLLAEILYKKGDYKQSIQTLYDLNEKFAFYERWLGKSFLLIADNYVALNEAFQAKATLNSLVEKSPLEEIKGEARKKLEEIDRREKINEPAQDTSIFQQSTIN